MAKKVVAIGACPGVEEILSMKGYSVEHVEQKNVLDVLRKEGIEAVIVDLDNTARANVVISGIRHLYPGLWVAAISDDGDNRQISQTLKAGASSYVVKPVNEKNLTIGDEKSEIPEEPATESKSQPQVFLDDPRKVFPPRFYNAFL